MVPLWKKRIDPFKKSEVHIAKGKDLAIWNHHIVENLNKSFSIEFSLFTITIFNLVSMSINNKGK